MSDPQTLPIAKLVNVTTHEQRVANANYWQGYADAIRHADATIKGIGDDPTCRVIRQAVLALIKQPPQNDHQT